MYKIASILAAAFFGFILWVIFLANTGDSSVFFDFVRAIPYGDKLGHMGLFGTLTLLTIVALNFRSFSLSKLKIYYGSLVVSIFVLTEELSQLFIPSRTFDLIDLSADFVGIILATGLAILINTLFTKKSNL